MLIRMANQSLLADMCAVLQDFLLRPELGMAVAVQEMSFRIDVMKLRVDAEALFRISTARGAPETTELSAGVDARLVLGSLRGCATVCLDTAPASGAVGCRDAWPRGALSFVFHRPSLNMITEAMLESTAAVLATERLEEERMFQNDDTEPSDAPESQSSSVFGGLLDRVAPDAVHESADVSIHDEGDGPRGGTRIGQRVVQGLVGALGGFVGAGSSN